MEILFVDDDLILLEQAELLLEKENREFKVNTATSAREGLKLLEKNSYDAIISDYQMPEMDGLEFLEVVRGRYQDLPFIIFTGKGREEVAMKALNLGADRYLQKGGGLSQYGMLSNAIVQEIERRRAENRLKNSERKFRKSFEAIPDPAFLLDKEGVFEDVNNMALKKLGFDREEIVGSSLWDVPFFPKETVEKTTMNFKRRKKGEKVSPYIVELSSEDGESVHVEVNVGVFEAEEDFSGEIVIARDITDRKIIEETVLDAASALISSIGTEELFQKIVDGARRISDAKFVSFALYNPEENAVVPKALSGVGSSLIKNVSRLLGIDRLLEIELPVDNCESFEEFLECKERKPIHLNGFYEYTFEFFDEKACKMIEKIAGIREIVAIPLLEDKKLVGLLSYIFPDEEKRNYTPLLIFADFASQAIQNSKRINSSSY